MKDKWQSYCHLNFPGFSFQETILWNFFGFVRFFFCGVFCLGLVGFFKELANEVENYIMKTFHNSF